MKRNHGHLLFVLILSLLIIVGCGVKTQWANNPQQLLSQDEIQNEISIKIERVNEFLDEEGLKGILLTQVRNVYWLTAGLTNNQIVL
ncbi:hypothetical protein KKA87_06280, partial [bacterium]|nr:hypothetical protein [bacterium]